MRERYSEKGLMFANLLNKMCYVDGIEPENYNAFGICDATLGYDMTFYTR